jgi:hypothetical protein
MAKPLTRSRSSAKNTTSKSRSGKTAKASTAKYKSRGDGMTASKARVVDNVSGVVRIAPNRGSIGIRQSSREDAADYLMALQARSREKGTHLSMAEVHARVS